MRVLVCGGRGFKSRGIVCRTLCSLRPFPTLIIHGGCSGADKLAAEWAWEYEVTAVEFPAEWDKYGRAAGPIRNQSMIDAGKPDVVVAFAGGRGTADMIRRATKAGVRIIEVPISFLCWRCGKEIKLED